VKITQGSFADFVGIVDNIELEQGKVRVRVSMAGRETPMELDLPQVERLV
jgi:transcriptional antiterminator NusG